jgi:hypothetical protein
MNAKTIIGGATLYFTAAGCAYWYIKSRPQVPVAACHKEDAPGSAFDRLANVYDDTVGREEGYMGYGLMRWWLLRQAKVTAVLTLNPCLDYMVTCPSELA